MSQARYATLSPTPFRHSHRARAREPYFATPQNVWLIRGELFGDASLREAFPAVIELGKDLLTLNDAVKGIDAILDGLARWGRLTLPKRGADAATQAIDRYLHDLHDTDLIRRNRLLVIEEKDGALEPRLAKDWRSAASIRRALRQGSKPQPDRRETWQWLLESVRGHLEELKPAMAQAWHEWVLEHRALFGIDRLEFLVPDADLEDYRSIP